MTWSDASGHPLLERVDPFGSAPGARGVRSSAKPSARAASCNRLDVACWHLTIFVMNELLPVSMVAQNRSFGSRSDAPGRVRNLAIPGGEVQVPLEAGRTVAIPLAAGSIPYRGVALRFCAAAPAQVTIRLCGPASCNERAMEVRNGEVALLPVPCDAAAGGGALSLSLSLRDGGVGRTGRAPRRPGYA